MPTLRCDDLAGPLRRDVTAAYARAYDRLSWGSRSYVVSGVGSRSRAHRRCRRGARVRAWSGTAHTRIARLAAGWLSLAVAVGAALFRRRRSRLGVCHRLRTRTARSRSTISSCFCSCSATSACHRPQRSRLLAFGILGAIAFRGLAIVAGVAILQALEQTIYVFGAGLLIVAYRSLVDGGARSNTAQGRMTRALTRVVPITDGFRGSRLLFARTRPFIRDAAPARTGRDPRRRHRVRSRLDPCLLRGDARLDGDLARERVRASRHCGR